MEKKNVPTELKAGSKIMIVSHAKIVGVTDIKEVTNELATLTKTHHKVGETIPKKINENGFIVSRGTWEVYYYNKFVCDKLGFLYNSFED